MADFELFKFVLPKICNLFFIFNQQNYCRYLIKYHDNLLKVDETHPGLRQQFERGSFGIKRTDKAFSRQPTDITLEQTINADAANKLTGIVHTSNSISARQRWCTSHTSRANIISDVMEQSGLRKSQDITSDLQKHKIKNSKIQLNTFIENIRQKVNPFAADLDKQYLFNISTGQAAEEKVADFLLNIEENGGEKCKKFIDECSQDQNKFESSIKKKQNY